MRCIIAGSRGAELLHVLRGMDECPWKEEITEVVSGKARGADSYGETWAHLIGLPIKEFPADWKTFGRSAGYRRNTDMADYADALVAIWDGHSKGTKHMIDLARSRGLRVFVYTYKHYPLAPGIH